jgi:soluble lytic murein transglycosylase-like protein
MQLNPMIILCLLAPWLMLSQARADIFAYADASGEIRLSNVPVESGYDLLIKEIPPEVDIAPLSPASVANLAAKPLPFDAVVLAAALETSLEPALLHAVIAAESNYDAHARSRRGALGLMQLMPATARRFRVIDPYNPAQNVSAGARYLRELSDLYQGDINLALAAYNAGPQAVNRFGKRIPPYAETQHYVPKVLRLYRGINNGLQLNPQAGPEVVRKAAAKRQKNA